MNRRSKPTCHVSLDQTPQDERCVIYTFGPYRRASLGFRCSRHPTSRCQNLFPIPHRHPRRLPSSRLHHRRTTTSTPRQSHMRSKERWVCPGCKLKKLSASSWHLRPLQIVLTSLTPCTLRQRPAMLALSQPSIEISRVAAKGDWVRSSFFSRRDMDFAST